MNPLIDYEMFIVNPVPIILMNGPVLMDSLILSCLIECLRKMY
jgi:hypothetical protein